MSRAGIILALLLLAALAGLTSHRRAEGLRLAYDVRRLVDDRGTLDNQVRWLRARVRRQETPHHLLTVAGRLRVVTDVRTRQPHLAPRRERPSHEQ